MFKYQDKFGVARLKEAVSELLHPKLLNHIHRPSQIYCSCFGVTSSYPWFPFKRRTEATYFLIASVMMESG
jgi:hypothetical protein